MSKSIFECRGCGRQSEYATWWDLVEEGWGHLVNIDGPDSVCPECVSDPKRRESCIESFVEDGYIGADIEPDANGMYEEQRQARADDLDWERRTVNEGYRFDDDL